MNKRTDKEDRALLTFGFNGGQGNTNFNNQMGNLSRRGYVLVWHYDGHVKFYMTSLGWRRCLKLTRPVKSQAYKLIKKLGEFDAKIIFCFDFGKIEFKGHCYRIVNE